MSSFDQLTEKKNYDFKTLKFYWVLFLLSKKVRNIYARDVFFIQTNSKKIPRGIDPRIFLLPAFTTSIALWYFVTESSTLIIYAWQIIPHLKIVTNSIEAG